MLCRIAFITLLALNFTVCATIADDGPARQTVRVELKAQPEFILTAGTKEEPRRSVIDSVVTTTPAAILTAVKDWTGISDRGKTITVKFYHTLHNSRFDAMSYGDRYSQRGSVKVAGKTLYEHETQVRYKEALASSDEKAFFVVGVHEFENRVTKRKCYVICQIQGQKPVSKDPKDAIIHPTGTATWTGPIVNASTVLFSDNDADANKR